MALSENITTANTLIHDDCLNVLPMLPVTSIDFILIDPPYIARSTSRDGRSVANDDNDRWLKPAFAKMHRGFGLAAPVNSCLTQSGLKHSFFSACSACP